MPTRRSPEPPDRSSPAPLLALLSLQLHGSARVTPSGGTPALLERRAAALCALAALEPGFPRERAAAWLWPDSGDARHNLRQQLLRFKQQFGTALLAGGDSLQLTAEVHLADPGDSMAPWLADHSYDDCEAFADWLHTQRQARQARLCEGLRGVLARAEAAQDFNTALQAAQALCDAEPEHEEHPRTLMRLHYLHGDAAAGLAVFARLVHRLHDTLGTTPAAETSALAAQLRRADVQHAVSPAAPERLPVTLQHPPRLVGRLREQAAVAAAWRDDRAVLLLGEPGLGKSRLLAQQVAAQRAATPPGVALLAAGRPGDTGVPYATLARLMQPLLKRPGDDTIDGTVDGTIDTRIDNRIDIRSEPNLLAQALGLMPLGLMPLGPATAAPLRPAQLAAAIERCWAQHAVALVAVDDLHFADDGSLELLTALMAPDHRPWRWLLAQRPAEGSAAARALRDSLCETRRLEVVALTPLDADAVTRLIDDLDLPGLAGASVSEALIRHTGGNPMYVLETLKLGLADGSLAAGRLPSPAGVGALIELRLRRLSEPALALARVAAIAGLDFCIELAEAAIGQSAVQLASAWRELQEAQVLRDEALAHDLVADALLRGVPPVVARRVHGQCAAWLGAHAGAPARVARHWREGGQPQAAAAAFEQAARRACEAARPTEEAELHLQAALAYADAGMAEPRFDALANRVSALIGAQSDTAALAEARALPEQAHTDTQRVRALRVLTDQLGQRGPFEDAIEVGQQGMALARRVGAQHELVRLTSLTAGNQIKIGRTQEAYSLMLPLREWVDREADDELRQIWYGYWAALLGHTGRLREGVASYEVAIACAERSGARAVVSMALLNQCVVLRTMGALQRATDASCRGLALLPADADSVNLRLARLMHARNEAESGRLGAAQSTLDELLPHFEAMGAPFWVHAVRATQARLWQHLGQHARALQALQGDDIGVPAWMQAGRLWIRLEVEQWLGLPLAEGPSQQALALLDGDANRRTGNAVRALRFATPLAVLQQSEALARSARSPELFGALAALQMHRSRAALALHRHDEAAAAARELLSLLHEGYLPDFVYTPEAWLVAGQALLAASDHAAAQAALMAGQRWVRTLALPQVPAPFIDSFLHRNPVNRELLALFTSPP